jgi:hypothetical protein
MVQIVDLPDGTEGEFPDDFTEEQITEVLRQQFPAVTAQPSPEQGVPGTVPGTANLAPIAPERQPRPERF